MTRSAPEPFSPPTGRAGVPALALDERLQREAEATLQLLAGTTRQPERNAVPPWLWLRSARACWLMARPDEARDSYRQAAASLLRYATRQARETGTLETYASLALGAAWMAQDRDLQEDVASEVESAVAEELVAADTTTDPLLYAALLLTRLRVAWYSGQAKLLKETDQELQRRVSLLDPWSKAFWREGRGSRSHAAIMALVALKPPPIAQALQALDQWLVAQRARPPSIGDLVDEELAAFAATAAAYRIPVPHLATPVPVAGGA